MSVTITDSTRPPAPFYTALSPNQRKRREDGSVVTRSYGYAFITLEQAVINAVRRKAVDWPFYRAMVENYRADVDYAWQHKHGREWSPRARKAYDEGPALEYRGCYIRKKVEWYPIPKDDYFYECLQRAYENELARTP